MTTLIGMITGFLLTFISPKEREEFNKISDHFLLIFMMLLLPPIIFESGYNMRKKPFFKNIGSVLMYSFLGTFIAIGFTSTMFYWCGQWNISYKFNKIDAWEFGSIISATDPVAVLAIF